MNSILIPPAEWERRGSNEREYLLFVGRMVWSKNPLFAIKIAEKSGEKLIMIGKGPLANIVKRRADISENIRYIPYIQRKVLFNYYSKAKALIHPALKDPIGFVIIEALSTQTPVIASSNAGASDFLPREWVIKDFNIENWIKKVKGICNSDSIKKAKEIFNKQHLNLEDPFFDEVARKLAEKLI